MAVAPAAAPASALGAGAGSDAAARLSLLDRGDCTYTACYCEENAYLLAQRLAQTGAVPTADCLHVVFVSNPRKQVPMWCQRAGQPPDGFIVWDYHVFVLEAAHPGLAAPRVWDLDTSLPFPCPLADYATAALPPVRPPYTRRFRDVPARALWARFASDRSHMRLPGGGWAAAPPAYPCIAPPGGQGGHNLEAFLDMRLPGEGGGGARGGSEGAGGSGGRPGSSSSDHGGGEGCSSGCDDGGGCSQPPPRYPARAAARQAGPRPGITAAALAAAPWGLVMRQEDMLACFLHGV